MNTKNDKSIPLTGEQIDLIIGTTLGDASLTKSRNKRKTASIRFSHSMRQEEYCDYKAGFLESISNHGCKTESYFLKGRGQYTTRRYVSAYTKEIYDIYSLFYINGRKSITDKICEMITVKSLAYWYMDDGSIETIKNKRNGEIHYIGNRVNLHTNGFSIEECEKLSKLLNTKFNFSFRVKKLGGLNKGQNILQMKSRESIERFVRILDSHIIESMKYKIKTSYQKPMRKYYSDKQVLRIIRYIKSHEHKDVIKYKKGKWLYETVRSRFGSMKRALEMSKG